jgi:hypothetical protein
MRTTTSPRTIGPHWYAPTTAKLLCLLLMLQGLLYLSQQLRSYELNYRKGHAVLIAVGATAIVLSLMAVSWLILRLFKVKSQFSLATLLMMVPVAAIPCAWLSRDLALAWRQRDIVAAVTKNRGYCDYRWPSHGRSFWAIPEPVLGWLDKALGHDFFTEVWYVDVWEPEELRQLHELPCLTRLRIYGDSFGDDDLDCLKNLPKLEKLEIIGTTMTDDGLRHLLGATSVSEVYLQDVRISDKGLSYLHGMRELRHLDLKGTKATFEDGQKFEKKSPRVWVHVW